MNEQTLTHGVIRFNHALDVITVNTNGYTGIQILWGFYDFVVYLLEIPPFKCFKSKIPKIIVSFRFYI